VLYSFCGRPLPTASSPLSLHDALPISPTSPEGAVMEHLHADAAQRYADLVARGSEAVLGLDFDGTLAPIVEDPTRARIHPDAAAAVLAAGRHLGAVAVITGRPVRQALDLGDLAELSDRLVEAGRELFVLGQYGNERWSSSHPEVVVPPVPAGV